MLDTVDQIYIAYLPLAHVLELLSENTMLLFGIKVCNVYVLLDEKKTFLHFDAKKRFASLFLCEKNAHHLGEKYFQNGTWINVWENKIFLELLTHFALIFVYT